jgi:predicted nucleotidyltransferase
VDLAIGMSGFEREVISRATRMAVGADSVRVVTVEDLLVMKALAGRPQDDVDLRGLVDLHRESIDWNRCLATATALGSTIDIDLTARLHAARDRRPPEESGPG